MPEAAGLMMFIGFMGRHQRARQGIYAGSTLVNAG
jgi:hypothetical protein